MGEGKQGSGKGSAASDVHRGGKKNNMGKSSRAGRAAGQIGKEGVPVSPTAPRPSGTVGIWRWILGVWPLAR